MDKEQEKKLNKLKRRFVKKYGEKKWGSLLKYKDVLWLTPTKISRLLEIERRIVYYWIKKIEKILCKKRK